MKNRGLRSIAALLAMTMLLAALAACGGGGGGGGSQGGNSTPEPTMEYAYTAKYYSLPATVQYVNQMVHHDGKFYFASDFYDEALNPDSPDYEGDRPAGVLPAPLPRSEEEPPAEVEPTPDAGDTGIAAPEGTEAPESDGDGEIMPIVDENWGPPQDFDYSAYERYYASRKTKVYSMNVDGSELQELPKFEMPEAPEKPGFTPSSNVQGLSVDATGNIWILISTYYITTEPSDVYIDGGNAYFLCKLNGDGEVIASVDLTPMVDKIAESQGYAYINGFAIDKDGNIYLPFSQQTLVVLDSEGEENFQIESDGYIQELVKLNDGRVAANGYDYNTGSMTLKPVSVAAKGWAESMVMPTNVYNMYEGDGDYAFYFRNESNLFGYDLQKGKTEKLLNWIDSDIDGNNVQNLTVLSDGSIATIMTDYSRPQPIPELVILTKRLASEIEPRTVLTMYTLYLDYDVRNAVLRFNKANEKYRISVTDYSEYNVEGNWDAGMTRLTADITTGNLPDLLIAYNLPVRAYASKGLLEDFYTYIDADPDFGRDKLVEPALRALEINDKLYQMSTSFGIETFAAKKSIVGDRIGWTFDEMNEILAAQPEGTTFMPNSTKQDLIWYACYYSMDQFVDWDTGKCYFDSDDFISLLELANTLPAEIDYSNWEDMPQQQDLLRSGKALVMQAYASSFEDLQLTKFMFGEDVSYVGFPNTTGKSGTRLSFNTGIMMMSSCKDKDGGWEFIKSMLTEEFYEMNSWQFPILKSAMDKKIYDVLHPDTSNPYATVSRGSMMFANGETLEMSAPTQAEIDEILELIGNAIAGTTFDEGLLTMIQEEIEPFFAGQKSARDTAAVIQSRATIYVNEQR